MPEWPLVQVIQSKVHEWRKFHSNESCSLAGIQIAENYWRDRRGRESMLILKCPVVDKIVRHGDTVEITNCIDRNKCREGHVGALCGVCKANCSKVYPRRDVSKFVW